MIDLLEENNTKTDIPEIDLKPDKEENMKKDQEPVVDIEVLKEEKVKNNTK